MFSSSPKRLGIATYRRHPEIREDDRLLVDALGEVEVTAGPWDDPDFRWAECDAVLLRSVWDYHLRVEQFLAWLEGLERAQVQVWNPPAAVRWNARKTYLRELEAAGIRTLPTVWLEGEDAGAYQRAIAESGWPEVVLKPIVGASSHLTYRSSSEEAAGRIDRLETLAAHGGALLQPFVPEIPRVGEWSLMFFGGEFSHAVRKRAADGEFRVQEEFGGSVALESPPGGVQQACESALARVPAETLYARIDGVELDGGFALTEVEVIEPFLFLGSSTEAPRRLASALMRRLGPEQRS